MLLLTRVVWIVLVVVILAGLTFLSWGVSREYFGYRTSSHITIRDYPEDGIKIPGLVACFHFNPNKITGPGPKIADLFTGDQNYWNDNDNSWKVRWIRAR